jgi:hypothetical protein
MYRPKVIFILIETQYFKGIENDVSNFFINDNIHKVYSLFSKGLK